MTTSDVCYRVVVSRRGQRLTIKEGFKTREEAEKYLDDFCVNSRYQLTVVEEKSQKRKYYEFIDSLLENARRELSQQDMVELINDLGVVLDMHFDGIRREVEDNFDGLMKNGDGLYAEE